MRRADWRTYAPLAQPAAQVAALAATLPEPEPLASDFDEALKRFT